MEDRPKTEVCRLLWDEELDGPALNPLAPPLPTTTGTQTVHTHMDQNIKYRTSNNKTPEQEKEKKRNIVKIIIKANVKYW